MSPPKDSPVSPHEPHSCGGCSLEYNRGHRGCQRQRHVSSDEWTVELQCRIDNLFIEVFDGFTMAPKKYVPRDYCRCEHKTCKKNCSCVEKKILCIKTCWCISRAGRKCQNAAEETTEVAQAAALSSNTEEASSSADDDLQTRKLREFREKISSETTEVTEAASGSGTSQATSGPSSSKAGSTSVGGARPKDLPKISKTQATLKQIQQLTRPIKVEFEIRNRRAASRNRHEPVRTCFVRKENFKVLRLLLSA